MSFNGSGTFLINTAGQPVVAGTVISSTTFNSLTADLATGLSTVITKDGQTTVTANIPMASFKFTGLGVGSAAGDSANLSQVQSTVTKLLASVSGADTVTATASPTLAAYAAGQMFYFVAAGDNTTSVTLNIDALGAKAVTRDGSVALAAADIKSGEVVVVVYDGTRFQVVSQLNSAGDARFANVSIASSLYVGGVSTFVGNAGFSANVSIVSALSVGGVATITGAASIQGLTVGRGAGAVASNTAVGASALAANSTGSSIVAVGDRALNANTGNNNHAFGALAGYSNTTGTENAFLGRAAGYANTTGGSNTAVGNLALNANTTASNNTAVGYQASYASTGANNSAFGAQALLSNTTGTLNSAIGQQSLRANTTGASNTAVGVNNTYSNTSGNYNTAVGDSALFSNTTANYNTAVGFQALYSNTTAPNNTAVGYQAGYAITSGTNNTYIGGNATPSGGGIAQEIVICTGNGATGKGDNTAFIYGNGGSTFNGANTTTWATTSDQRLKKNIVDNTTGLSAIAAIRVRNFEYRLPEEVIDLPQAQAIAKTGVQLGVIAQELQQVLPECVKTESTGVMTVDTDNLTWYMVNAIKELKAEFDAYKASHH